MVFDKIENSKLYTSLSEDIAKGLAFIVENELAQLEPGKYEIDKDNVLAIVQEYETKGRAGWQIGRALSAHRYSIYY